MFILDEKLQRKLENINFVESVSTDVVTQNTLLESLESDNKTGRFNSAEEMFDFIEKEWEKEDKV